MHRSFVEMRIAECRTAPHFAVLIASTNFEKISELTPPRVTVENVD
jgi:hypothetical protein